MARFFFDVSHSGDVYHDAHGINLPDPKAKERAFEIVRKLVEVKAGDVVCSVRDINGKQLMQIKVEWKGPRVGAEFSN
jgi:hypothetical protein